MAEDEEDQQQAAIETRVEADLAAELPPPFRAKSRTEALLWPSAIPSAIARTMRLHERIASSFPGMT